MRATGQRNDLIGALECEFATLFRATRRLGQQVAREVHPDLDLNAYLLLLHLTQASPTRLTDTADAFDADEATMSRPWNPAELVVRTGLLRRLNHALDPS